jgi:acyl-CoA thioester hydrolase
MTHLTHITARGNELDSFGHVNNAVYLNYLEQARWEFFRDQGWLGFFQNGKMFLVVTELNIRYQREVLLFDELEISTRISESPPFLVFEQKILNRQTKLGVARAKTRTVFVDRQRLPQDIPGEIRIVLNGKNR